MEASDRRSRTGVVPPATGEEAVNPGRRSFLVGAGAAPAALLALGIAKAAAAEDAAPSTSQDAPEETEHMRRYYACARF